jgi:hypothetical protein
VPGNRLVPDAGTWSIKVGPWNWQSAKDSDRSLSRAYGALQARLRTRSKALAEVPTVVLSAFDGSTRPK